MPRIPHSLLLRAHKISPLLTLVLRATRTLPSAVAELRWLVEHLQEDDKTRSLAPTLQKQKLLQLCKRRQRGEPLQYILGTQPFGELTIKCRPGVLIPRPETEAYTSHVAKLLLEGSLHKDLDPKKFEPITVDWKEERPEPLKILDLCSGSGCISLLLYSLLSKRIPNIQIRGYDISEKAHKLSIENLRDAEKTHFHKPSPVEFCLRDIHDDTDSLQIDPKSKTVDIIISNPPYIGETAFNKSTSRSVRNFEPRLALVPSRSGGPGHGRFFYWRLLQLHKQLRSRVLVMEVSGARQAAVVARLARFLCGSNNTIELWRDWPDQDTPPDKKSARIDGKWTFPVKGAGSYRTVVLRRHPSKTADVLEDTCP